jgi:hypothetical protein
VPLKKPEDVIPHLGKAYHWRTGGSAKSLAECWFAANDLPDRIRAVVEQAEDLVGAELIDAWLERSTDLCDGRPTHSQTDLFAILGLSSGLAVLGVEAKVTEPFGPLVGEWIRGGGAGKQERLHNLHKLLGLDRTDSSDLRYQLLHRTAAVLLETRRYRTDKAILLVQSFCPQSTGFEDFALFCERLGYRIAAPDMISPIREIGGVQLRVGWVSDEVPVETP